MHNTPASFYSGQCAKGCSASFGGSKPPNANPRCSVMSTGFKQTHCNEASDYRGERCSDYKEQPAGSLPKFSKGGHLSENVHNVRRAIRHICHDSQQEQLQAEIESEHRPRHGITDAEVNNHYCRQHDVVEYPPRLPESDRICSTIPQRVGVHQR